MKEKALDKKVLRIPDGFVRVGQKAIEWLANHRSKMWWTLGGIAALLVLNYGFNLWQEKSQTKAWSLYHESNKLPGEERWKRLEATFPALGSSRAGLLAASQLGDHYLSEAKKSFYAGKDMKEASKQALDWYEKALKFSKLSPIERQLLLVNHGEALEMGGQLDAALRDYEEASGLYEIGKPWAWIQAARIHRLKGKTDAVSKIYEQLIRDYPNTEYAKYARNRLRYMTSPLFDSKKGG